MAEGKLRRFGIKCTSEKGEERREVSSVKLEGEGRG